MAKGLYNGARRASREDQMLGRGMAQIDHTLSQNDPSRRSVGQIVALSRDLRRQPEQIGRADADGLHLDPVSRANARATSSDSGKGARAWMELG